MIPDHRHFRQLPHFGRLWALPVNHLLGGKNACGVTPVRWAESLPANGWRRQTGQRSVPASKDHLA